MTFNRDWMRRFGWPDADGTRFPIAIAHRGASDYETENTLPAFRLATGLMAEMWEVDVQLSADGAVAVCHDDNLARLTGEDVRITRSRWSEVESAVLPGGRRIPRLEEVVDLAAELGAGLYVEAKSEGSAEAAWRVLSERRFAFAAIGSFRAEWIAGLRRAGCPLPLSVLVPFGVDPFEYGRPARPDILHLCWRNAGPSPQRLVTRRLVERCCEKGMAVVLWHEDRREVLDALEGSGALGICSDRPECLKPSRRGKTGSPAIVCHRGACHMAPENTLEAARICVDQAFDFVEVDIRTARDGTLVAMHDPTVDRTTDGSGPVSSLTHAELVRLDAGSWFSQAFAGQRVPTLDELLDLVRGKAGLYIEIKQADLDETLRRVRARDMLDRVFFSCMNLAVMRRMRSLSPQARLMAPRWMYPSLEAAVEDFGADIVEFEPGVCDLAEMDLCRERGVQAMVYSQTRSASQLAEILASAPDLVNLDRPDLFKILASYPDLAWRLEGYGPGRGRAAAAES